MRKFILIAAFIWLPGAASAGEPSSNVQRMLAGFSAATGQLGLLDSLPSSAPPPAAVPKPVAYGFKLVYGEAKTAQAKKWKKILQGSMTFDKNVKLLNARFALPFELVIETSQCGEANAWYHSSERKITFCYEEIAAAARLLKARGKTKKDADQLALGDALHTFYHEVGHALIDVFNLPTVGREEDAVDQFATLTLLSFGEEGELAAEVAAMQFLQSHKENGRLSFWDEHSFDKQRHYDTLCLIYGKDPDKRADMVGPRKLPEKRAERCPAEYEHLDAAWKSLLAPHQR